MAAAALFDSLRSARVGEVRAGEPMSRHTTWRVGGPADLFVVPESPAAAGRVLEILRSFRTPWLVVGSGSNLLVRDGGWRGAVIHTGRLRGLDFGPGGRVRVGAGLPVMTLLQEAAAAGLEGLEELAGIPGTVGGAAAMNAGAGGQEFGRVVRTLTLADGATVETWPAERLNWSYRSSGLPPGRMILELELQLQPGRPEAIREAMARRLALRRKSQGVGGPSAGSVFRNPPGESAWQLIDAAGFRGAAQGTARVSEVHTNVIVSEPGGRARDILELMERIRHKVLEKSGIELEAEVRIVGDEQADGAVPAGRTVWVP